ncbi:hypothetical protein GSY69_01785 [Brevibacterium sp. 5221]|uniref:Uncharacterized protein n=1 Tax=Brevibacterium rongguiense TaxID=2695267 RepID=A0A6N9H4A2_9MICO|nr:hypothetical protein [Brevibacterium rongguiense]MYM18739.1 hypothetical protein [Brevibacterium rongguiense]
MSADLSAPVQAAAGWPLLGAALVAVSAAVLAWPLLRRALRTLRGGASGAVPPARLAVVYERRIGAIEGRWEAGELDARGCALALGRLVRDYCAEARGVDAAALHLRDLRARFAPAATVIERLYALEFAAEPAAGRTAGAPTLRAHGTPPAQDGPPLDGAATRGALRAVRRLIAGTDGGQRPAALGASRGSGPVGARGPVGACTPASARAAHAGAAPTGRGPAPTVPAAVREAR